ncbi:response regulator transcription factor [Chryseobacterium sp. T1]
MKILLVEDHEQLAKDIRHYLQKENYICGWVSTVAEAKEHLEEYEYDFVLLDLTLPDNSGLYLLEFIKKNKIPGNIIIISAQNSLDYKIKGLDGGADDYITKPFPLPELHSRIKAVNRRKNPEQCQELTFNEIQLNLDAVQCLVSDKEIILTRKEFNLLSYFINNKNRVLSKQSIALHLWGDYTYNLDNVDFIYQHLKNLRKKITDAGGTDYITTVYGLGYKWSE